MRQIIAIDIKWKNNIIPIILLLFAINGFAQLSPGDLANPHAHLEGLSNCTDCHVLGDKITNEKCLDCHKLLKHQIDRKKGYHSSEELAGKECVSCHSDHHGKKFDMIRFDKKNFDHLLAGYKLEDAHQVLNCEDCHQDKFIVNQEIKNLKKTFLGLKTECLSCHEDYHQKTLSNDCMKCHDYQSFEKAPNFDHQTTEYPLIGKHQKVACIDCHQKTTKNDQPFQEFIGIAFKSCTDCHDDVHDDKFGQNCTKCHDEHSFQNIKGMSDFDHNTTNYKLVDLHELLDCKDCHKTKLIDPIKHNLCTDCHDDFHEGQLMVDNKPQDCVDCHSTKGFTGSSYTIELHNRLDFVLEGAHLATPCFECHKDKEKWSFKDIGSKCSDCHEDIHETFIDKKYYNEGGCENCHSVNWWSEIEFNHDLTDYKLEGKHQDQTCRSCHFKDSSNDNYQQKFSYTKISCTECHLDEHQKQFEINSETDCLRCHTHDNWKVGSFDHDKTLYPLDGKHKDVACKECHIEKQIGQNTFVQYKLKEFRCEDCH